MPIWNIAAVADAPDCTLVQSSVMALPNGDWHVVGYAVGDREAARLRASKSSTLRGFAITSSGRARGQPGWGADAEYTWNRWRRINDAAEWSDITDAAWLENQAASLA